MLSRVFKTMVSMKELLTVVPMKDQVAMKLSTTFYSRPHAQQSTLYASSKAATPPALRDSIC